MDIADNADSSENGKSVSDNLGSLSADGSCFLLTPNPNYFDSRWNLCQLSSGTLVYPITSKEDWFSFFTQSNYDRFPDLRGYWSCNRCPQPLRSISEIGIYQKRCKSCNTKATRYKRAKRLSNDIENVSLHFGMKVKWITLTLPNYNDPLEGLADIKKKVKKFRQKDEFQKKIIGGADFYEWTSRETDEGLSYNVHYHGLWIGNYWKQSELMQTWKHGGARIEDASNTVKRLRYCVSYTKKQQMFGIRSQQRFGCLYGTVFHALDEFLQTPTSE